MASIDTFVCTAHRTTCLDNRLTELSNLQDLQVSVTNSTGDRDEWKIGYHAIDWEALHHLTHVTFARHHLMKAF